MVFKLYLWFYFKIEQMNIKKSIVLASVLGVSRMGCGPDDDDDVFVSGAGGRGGLVAAVLLTAALCYFV